MDILRNLRYGLRMLRKHPGHTATAVVALALGIGLTTAVFSLIYGALMRGLPFPQPEEIMHLETSNPSRDEEEIPIAIEDFYAWEARQTTFEGLAGYYQGTVNLSGDEKPERFDGAFVSADTFELLGVAPALGRGFVQGEDTPQAEPVVVLGHEVWKARYGGDPGVIGKPVRLNGQAATVVGVMPPGFGFPVESEVWTPLRLDPEKHPRGGNGLMVEVVGRLKDGVSLEEARQEMTGIVKALALEYPETNEGLVAVVQPYTDKYVGDDVSALLFTMLGAVVCVLLIACANVANLMLARAVARTRELAIRSALGAGRRAVIAQILLESCMISALGAAFGLGLAWWGVELFSRAIVDSGPPFWLHFAIDPPALVFTIGATVLAGVTSGLVPALRASRADLNSVLKDEGRGSTSLKLGRFGKGLVVAEVALSCVGLVMAGLMAKSVVNLRSMDFGFETANLLTARIALFDSVYPGDADKAAFFEKLLARLEEQPGVLSAAVTSNLPLGSGMDVYALEGRAYPTERDLPLAHSLSASPGYFRVLGKEVAAGRDFGRLDMMGSLPVAIVNQSFAAKAWPGEDPLGRRVRVGGGEAAAWRTVVGVVPDLLEDGINTERERESHPEAVYVPLAQAPRGFMSVVMRTAGDPLAATPLLRKQVTAIDPDLPIYFVFSMDEVLANEAFFPNLFGGIFLFFGAVALLLASVGIYGVLAFSVRQRTQEIGVRMALGAGRSRVLGLILRQGTMQLGLGLAVGLVLAWLGSKPLASFLFGVQPSDPPIFVGTTLFLSAVALFACYLPAERATRVDPMVAFRSE